jgi:drug/metabolite transporter (DMT)-like permease
LAASKPRPYIFRTMKRADPKAFERNRAEAPPPSVEHDAHMIRTVMNRSDWLILGSLSLIWGAAFFLINIAVREVPTITYVWLRLTLAATGLWLFFALRGRSIVLPRSTWTSFGLLALLNNALPFILIGWSETQIASGLASILNATSPIFAVIAAHFLTEDERMSPAKAAGILIGFAGVATMLAPTLDAGRHGAALAVIACLIASLSYALAGIWARRFRKAGLSPMATTIGQLTAGALILLPVAMVVDRPWQHALPSMSALGAILALALVCSAFAYTLYFRLIASAGATNALLVTLLVPVTAVLLGVVLLHERLGIADLAGMMLIALGLAAIDGRAFNWAWKARRRLRTAI